MSESASGAGEARVAVVQAGDRMGRAVCQALAAKGMRVGVVYSRAKPRRASSPRAPRRLRGRADLCDPAQVDALVEQLQEVAGQVDVCRRRRFNRGALMFSMKLDDYDAVAGLARAPGT